MSGHMLSVSSWQLHTFSGKVSKSSAFMLKALKGILVIEIEKEKPTPNTKVMWFTKNTTKFMGLWRLQPKNFPQRKKEETHIVKYKPKKSFPEISFNQTTLINKEKNPLINNMHLAAICNRGTNPIHLATAKNHSASKLYQMVKLLRLWTWDKCQRQPPINMFIFCNQITRRMSLNFILI